jgi:hypothetical protein
MLTHPTYWRHLYIDALVVCGVLMSSACLAHPMGNFSINHYAGIRFAQDSIEMRYVIDMAEIPTFQEIQQSGLVTSPKDASARGYIAKQEEALKAAANGVRGDHVSAGGGGACNHKDGHALPRGSTTVRSI